MELTLRISLNRSLAGADMGPAKRSKAEALKVQVIDEDAYMRMINE